MVCTADRFERKSEGKAEGLDLVLIVVDEVSLRSDCYIWAIDRAYIPLFLAPQTLHARMAFGSPHDPSSRSPQSVQNTSDPMAAIVVKIY